MAGNELTNAGFAEGTSFWDNVGVAGPPYIDESVYGYEGRPVFVAPGSGSGTAIAQQLNKTVQVTIGQVIEVFAHHAAVNGQTVLYAMFAPDQSFTGNIIQSTVPVVSKGDGNPRLGLAKSYNFSHARITSPINGYVRLYLHCNNTGPNPKSLLMKPYLERVLPKTKYRCWDPGIHVNPDLQIPHWPSELPHLRADQFSAPIIPSRVGFSGDKGVSVTKKLTRSPWYNVTGQLRGTRRLMLFWISSLEQLQNHSGSLDPIRFNSAEPPGWLKVNLP